MTNAAPSSAAAKPENAAETRKIVLKEIGAKWGKFSEQDLSALKNRDDVVTQIVAKYGPVYVPYTIAKGTYPNQEKDNQVAAVWNILATRDDFPEDLAYKLTKLMIEKREDLGKVHKEALNIKVENQKAANAGVPWHKGALKYFAEKGIKVD